MIISVAIVAAGYIGFNRLNYWERSARIFNMTSSGQQFGDRRFSREAGFDRRGGFGERGGFERPESGQITDSLRRRFDGGNRRQAFGGGNLPDSLRQQGARDEGEGFERGPFEGGGFGTRGGQGRHGFDEGNKINLRNIVWFLAVFASFTVVVIYIDKACYSFRRKRS